MQHTSAIILEKDTLLPLQNSCRCSYMGTLTHSPSESQPGARRKRELLPRAPNRGRENALSSQAEGHSDEQWCTQLSSACCPQGTGWAPRGKSDFQALVSLQLHAIYLLVPDTLQRAFVNLLEKTHTLITEGSYSQDAMWSKLAPSSDVAS